MFLLALRTKDHILYSSHVYLYKTSNMTIEESELNLAKSFCYHVTYLSYVYTTHKLNIYL